MTTSSTTSTSRRDARAALDRFCAERRAEVLESAVEILATAAENDDANLALTCRGILDALRTHPRRAEVDPRPEPLTAPGWASRSVHEDGRTVHETVSPIHPTVITNDGRRLLPTDVSLSAADESVAGRWVRTRPTIQIEGGSYPLTGVRQLRAAVDDLLRLIEGPDDRR